MAHVCLHSRKRVHTRLSEKDRTQRLTRRNTGRFGWGWYHYPRTVPHVSETLRGRVSERQVLPLLGLGRVLPKNAESLRNSDALMRVAVPRRRGPAGLRDLFRFCRNRDLYIRRSWFSACARHGWYHYPRSVSHGSETLRGRVSERQTLPLLGLGRVYARRTQKACGTAMRLCASLFRGVAAPPGCVIFFRFC